VTIWATDEHRLGLLPVVRRIWAPCGQRPIAPVRRRYEGRSVHGVVRPTTGQTWWCLRPTVNTEAVGLARREFARDAGSGPTRRAVLGLDQAGWHASRELVLPPGIGLAFLPTASPERQPAERPWRLVDEPVAKRTFADLDALAAVLVTRCRTLAHQRRPIKTRTRYHRWPRERRGKRK